MAPASGSTRARSRKTPTGCARIPQCRIVAGVDDNASARSDGKIANIALAVGGAAVITAGVLWLTGGSHAPDSVAIVPQTGGMAFAFGGRF